MDKKYKDKIYWIGGSPCSGKSTMAEMLVKDFGFDYYKCDDYLGRYIDIGVKENNSLMKKISKMSLDEIWLRSPGEQVEEEFEFYCYALTIIEKDIEKMYTGKDIIVEGAAILPEYIYNNNINHNKYICIVPEEKFQMKEYSKREWVKRYLKDSSDSDKAFENWMKRDAIYAKRVMHKAKEYGMNYILVDGTMPIDEQYSIVKEMFDLV